MNLLRNPFLKLALRYTFRMLVGVLGVVLIWDKEGHLAFIIGIAGGLYALWNLSLLGMLGEARAALKYPEYNEPVVPDSKLEKWLHRLALAFFYATLLGSGIWWPPLDNHIHTNDFLIIYGLLGVALATVTTSILKKMMPSFFKNNHTRAVAILGLWLSIAACTVMIAGHYNMATAKANLRTEKAFVQQKTKNVSTSTRYLYLQLATHEERFSPRKASEWDAIAVGDSLELTVGKGELGYSYIFHFKRSHSSASDLK
ncbi:hypothetical protein [uncultured Pontibacter sp.]|uniref:hypothetical protein n=1 Tax=uncultured Pontibacter sp. TaxID=453356 RepID=UPI00262925A6|nr:hypothetical protein [uncultured Pontibacter sp.]